MKSLYLFENNFTVLQVTVTKNLSTSNFEVLLQIEFENKNLELYFKNPDDIEVLMEIFDANRIEIEEDYKNGKEFGNIKLGFSGESHIEIYFDSVKNVI